MFIVSKALLISSTRLQTTQPTRGGAVTADSSCCVNCVELSRPQKWGNDLPCFGHAGHADPLDGATGLNTVCTSDVQVSAKHNTQITGPAIYTENPDSHLTQT